MKRIFSIIMLAAMVTFAAHADLNGKKILIDPGHGAWDSESRNLATINHALGDTTGFWETNTNLHKGLYLYYKLKERGATVYLTRTRNGQDPSLSSRAAMANNYGVDAMISIHSNATTEGTNTNYVVDFFKGVDGSSDNPQSLPLAQKMWTYGNDNPLDTHTYLPMNVRGCTSFYGYTLGVLNHSRPGTLVEGYFHTYQPARHRALNYDYDRMEGMRYYRAFCNYFSDGGENVGYINGIVRDKNNVLTHNLYKYNSDSEDNRAPINGALVTLYNSSGTQLATYTTDREYNGVFVFKNLAPGTYYVKVKKDGYKTLKSDNITVSRNATTSVSLHIEEGAGGDYTPTTGNASMYIYAFDLAKIDLGNAWTFTYKLNDFGQSGKLVCYDENDGGKKYEFPLTQFRPNIVNEVTVPKSKLPKSSKIRWEIYVKGSSPSNNVQQLYYEGCKDPKGRSGMAIDTNPESPYFPNLYYVATNHKNSDTSGETWINVLHPNGANFDRLCAPKAPTTGDMYRIWDIHTDWKGNLYFSGGEVSEENKGIWMFDMAKLYNNTFATKAHPISDHYVQTFSIFGTGADQKLVTDEYDYSGGSSTRLKIRRYDIGDTDGTSTWKLAKAFEITTVQNSYRTHIQGDPHGTVWFSQRLSGENQQQAAADPIQAYDFNGNRVFGRGEHSMNYSGMAVDTRRNILYYLKDAGGSVGGNQTLGTVNTIRVDWNGTTPSIDYANLSQVQMNVSGVVPTKMAVDYAGNAYLYAANYIYRIVRGGMTNECTTPARSTEAFDNSEYVEQFPEHLYVYGNVSGYSWGTSKNVPAIECENVGDGKYYVTIVATPDSDNGRFDFSANFKNKEELRYGPTFGLPLDPTATTQSVPFHFKDNAHKTNAYQFVEEGVYYVELDLKNCTAKFTKRTNNVSKHDNNGNYPKVIYAMSEVGGDYTRYDRRFPIVETSTPGVLSGYAFLVNKDDITKCIFTATPNEEGNNNWDGAQVKQDRYGISENESKRYDYTLTGGSVTTPICSSKETWWGLGNNPGLYKITINFNNTEKDGVAANSVKFEKQENGVYLFAPTGSAFRKYNFRKFKETIYDLYYFKPEENIHVGASENKLQVFAFGDMRASVANQPSNVTNHRCQSAVPTSITTGGFTVDENKDYNLVFFDHWGNNDYVGTRTYDGVDYSAKVVKKKPEPTASSSYLNAQPETYSWKVLDNLTSVRFHVMDANGNRLVSYRSDGDEGVFTTENGITSVNLYGLYNSTPKAAYIVVEQLANIDGGDNGCRDISEVALTGSADKLNAEAFAELFVANGIAPTAENGKTVFNQKTFPGGYGVNLAWNNDGNTAFPAYYQVSYVDRNQYPSGYDHAVVANVDGEVVERIDGRKEGSPIASILSNNASLGYAITTQWEDGQTTPFVEGNPVTIEYLLTPVFLVYNPNSITAEITVPASDASLASVNTKANSAGWTDFSVLPENVDGLKNVTKVVGKDITINVVYDHYDPETGVEGVLAAKAMVYGTNGEIIVDGAEGTVSVFALSGANIATVNATSNRLAIPVQNGIYLVKVAGATVKVAVK